MGRISTASLEERFFSKVQINPQTGCWDWTGSKDTKGYGAFKADSGTTRAHRVSFTLHRGEIPKGMHICHRCDNRGCMNPDHMFLGSHAENMADRNAKDRQAKLKGIANGMAKLSEEDVIAIRSARGFSNMNWQRCLASVRR